MSPADDPVSPLADALAVDPDQVRSIVTRLRERNETVATAESLTGGLVCALLTAVPGASVAVRGGLIVYTTPLKATLAGVNGRALYEYGAVHPLIAEELADGARERCTATWGVGLTGVAGPDPQDGVEPGTVYVAVAGPARRTARTLAAEGDRHAIRSHAVRGALDLLQKELDRPSRGS